MVADLVKYPVQVGDYVVQAYNKGRCAALKFAKVLRVNEDKGTFYLDGIELKKGWNGNPDTWEFCSRPYTLQYPERCMVIPDKMLPAKVNHMFEEKYGKQ